MKKKNTDTRNSIFFKSPVTINFIFPVAVFFFFFLSYPSLFLSIQFFSTPVSNSLWPSSSEHRVASSLVL